MSRVQVGIAAAVLLVLLLLGWGALSDGGWLPWGARAAAPPGAGDDLLGADRDLAAELRRRADRSAVPGLEGLALGHGALTGSVRLHVPGEPARPLPGVAVLVLCAKERRGRVAPADPAEPPERLTQTVETAADGTFVFPELRARAGYALVIRHPPYREVVRMGVAVARDRTTDLGEILLGAPTTLTGEVVDAAGRPVGKAQVQVFLDRSRPDRFDLRAGLFDLQSVADPLAEADALADGRFTLRDLSPGRYLLRVSAPGFATAFRTDVRVTLDERSGRLRVVLDPGAGWTGTVRDEDGRPVPGARLVAVALPGERLQRVDRVDVTAGPDGAYRLDTLVAGVRYFVEAWAEGYAPTGQALVAEGVAQRDVVVVRSGRVEGRVADARSGAPVAEAQVTLLAGLATTLSPVSTVTDAEGRYALAHVAPGPVLLLSVKAVGYEAYGAGADAFAGRRVAAGETLVFDVALQRGGTVSGRLTAADGRAVPYATVALVDPRRRWEGEEAALTDAQGRYRVVGLHAAAYELRVTAPGYAPLTEEADLAVTVPPDLAPVTRDIVLSAGAALVGKVRTPDGALVGGASVEVSAAGPPELRARVRDLVAVTDPAGGFRLLGVPPGIDLIVSASHDDWVRGTLGPLRLLPGREQEVALALRVGGTLPGRVVDAAGRPVEGARVRWGHVGPENEDRVAPGDAFRADEVLGPRVVRSDADGRFALDRLEPGRLLLKVEREGFAPWYRRDLVVSGEGPQPAVTVALEGSLAVRGRVTAQDGGPLAGVWVYAEENRPGADQPQDPGRVRALVATQTAEDGGYVLEGLPPARVKVAVWLALGFKPQTRRDVEPGGPPVDFALEPVPPPPAAPRR